MKKVLIIALLASTTAMAQTSTTTVPTGDAAGVSTIKPDEANVNADRKDIDQEITNARMRATTGSKSKWSFASAFNYNGSSVERPFAKVRPGLSQDSTAEAYSSISGDVSGKYRLTDHQNLNVGTGLSLTTPGYSGQKLEASTPYVQWSHVGKLGELQSVISVGASYFTKASHRDGAKLDYSISADHTLIKSLGTSGVDLGFVYSLGNNFYQDGPAASDVYGNDNARDDYTIAGFLFMEYAFNDTFSFRTVYRGLTFSHLRDESAGMLRQADPTQSMGLGMAVTRDIYLYPNVQWVWGNMRADQTNVALSANINVF